MRFALGQKTIDNAKLQEKLIDTGFPVGPSGADGIYGRDTTAAVVLFRKYHGLGDATTVVREGDGTFELLFPELKKPKGTIMDLPVIGPSIRDYFLNFITSKINWAAAALVTAVVSYIGTKWGFNVPDDVQKWVIGLLVSGGSALIMLLRTFWNAPKVVTKMPEVITEKGALK